MSPDSKSSNLPWFARTAAMVQPGVVMAPSPLAIGLKKRFGKRSENAEEPEYRVFTRAFDEVVDPARLSSMFKTLTGEQKRSFDTANERFDTLFTAERVEIAASGAALVRALQHEVAPEERARSVVSLLIDHSGSMRGLRMMSALLAVEGALDALTQGGIATEVLGFTTTSWKGGKSRRAWRWADMPSNPGRLCDLRHIVYAEAGRNTRFPWQLRMALRSEMLHENVDGEALLWAAGRLDVARWTKRVICLISDGAPVDDSTLLANDDRELLARHLEVVEQRLITEGFTIGTLLIGREHVRKSALMERANEPQGAGVALMELLGRALLHDR